MCREKKENVLLIGMPGSGKSTVGARLADALGYRFCDMDHYIEEISQRTISDMFAEEENVFRAWETKACELLSEQTGFVFAAGGGLIKRSLNIELMSVHCRIVFLNRPIEQIINDVDYSTRPLLRDGEEQLRKLYSERLELYIRSSDVEIMNTGTEDEAVASILRALSDEE